MAPLPIERDVLADARRDAHDRAGVARAAVAFAGHTVIFHQTPAMVP